jgi:hypothetical protein
MRRRNQITSIKLFRVVVLEKLENISPDNGGLKF